MSFRGPWWIDPRYWRGRRETRRARDEANIAFLEHFVEVIGPRIIRAREQGHSYPTGQPCPLPDRCGGELNGSGVCVKCGLTQGGYPLRREDYPELFEVIRARAAYEPDKPFRLPVPGRTHDLPTMPRGQPGDSVAWDNAAPIELPWEDAGPIRNPDVCKYCPLPSTEPHGSCEVHGGEEEEAYDDWSGDGAG